MLERRPEFFLVDILVAIDKIKRRSENITFKQFISDEDAVDSIMRNLEIIGEASGQILKYSDFVKESDIPWRKIVDFRNVAIHFYFGIDLDIVFKELVKEKIPQLEKTYCVL